MEEDFLKEYELLCQKYKMGLRGCGCCYSPWLNEIGEINYNEKLNKVLIGGDGFWKERELEGTLEERDKKYLEKTIDEYFKEGDK